MKTIINPNSKVANDASLAVASNDGHCPCAIEKTEDTKCMCKAFREQIEPGLCQCGLYLKVEE